MIPIKIIKKNFLYTIKVDQKNTFFENGDKSYTVVDLYINSNRDLKYIDSYNYYDIDVDKILFLKKVIMNILLDITM